MNIEKLRNSNWIIFSGIVGSQAYGISTPTSDIDTKGVFIQPLEDILGFGYIDQISDDKNDSTYYEIRRFLDLLKHNNPNILELLNLPDDCILHKDPIFDMILSNKEKFVTKICRYSFGGYAVEQIKKARGLNKKISNPIEPERKSVLDFCYVPHKQGSIPVKKWLEENGLIQELCGLAAIDHMRYTYGLYYDFPSHLLKSDNPIMVPPLVREWNMNTEFANDNQDIFDHISIEPRNYRGLITNEETSNDVSLSDIPKGEFPLIHMQVNLDGYSTYCKKYKEYWDWVEKRNPQRYLDNISHEGAYDGKNIAHCHRLLDMAIEIGEGKGINVRRENREELLSIRRGEANYDDLIQEAEKKINRIEEVFISSEIPEDVDKKFVDDLLIEIRKKWYNLH
jgi:uncharacterized protein